MLQLAALLVIERSLRQELFGTSAQADLGWHILTRLYVAESKGETVLVKNLTFGTGVPYGTAMRWMRAQVRLGTIEKRKDLSDNRQTRLALTPHGKELMQRYLRKLCAVWPEI